MMQQLEVSILIYDNKPLLAMDSSLIYQRLIPVLNRRRFEFSLGNRFDPRIQYKDGIRDGQVVEMDIKSNILATTPLYVLQQKVRFSNQTEHQRVDHGKIVLVGLTIITIGLVEFLVYVSTKLNHQSIAFKYPF